VGVGTVPSRIESGDAGAPTDFRVYWSPWYRTFLYGYATLAAGAVVLTLTAGHPVLDAFSWTVLTLSTVAYLWGLLMVGTAGVHETPTGITWRGGMTRRSLSGEASWTDMRGFGYVVDGLSFTFSRTLVVELADGTRRRVSPATSKMRWKGGSAYDFAGHMTERARAFGAPIEKYHTLGLVDRPSVS